MSIKENNKMIYLFSAIAFVVLLIVALAAACESGKGTKRTDESVPDSAVYYDSNVDTEEVSSSPEQESQEITEPVIEVLSGNISEELDKISKKYGAVAVQAAVIEDGHVRYVYNYGYADLNKKTPVTEDTKFRLASLSKLATAMTVMTIYEDGLIDLDADISDYIGYSVKNPKYPDTPITPRMLMSHTSTIVNSESFLDARNKDSSVPLKDLLKNNTSFSRSKPGTKYAYSNFGVAVLAAAAECIVDEHFSQYAHDRIFSKMDVDCEYLASMLTDQENIANIYSTGKTLGWSVSRQLKVKDREKLANTYHIYQGNLTCSAKDYAQLLCVLMNGGQYKGKSIISEKSADMIMTTQFSDDKVNQCMCLQVLDSVIQDRKMYCHTGSCYGAFNSFAFDAESKSGVVVVTTGVNAKKNSSGLYNICADIIREVYGTVLD